MTELHKRVMEYQAGTYPWFDLYKDLYHSCQTYMRYFEIDEADAHECFYENLDRIKRACQRYEYKGRDFRNFLYMLLDWMKISYFKRKKRLENQEQSLYATYMNLEASVQQSSETYLVEEHLGDTYQSQHNHDAVPVNPNFAALNPRQKKILLIGLRNCLVLDDDACKILSRESSVDYGWLLSTVHLLRRELIPQLEVKRNKRLSALAANIKHNKAKITGGHRVAVFPQHARLADLLNIPKGTVNSIFHHCQRLEKQGRVL